MAYTKQTWADGSTGATPINATRLQHLEDGVGAAQTTADTAQTAITGLTADGVTDATATGKALIRAASTTAARAAIQAGTSDLALGTTSTTAKAGNWKPAVTDITATGTASSTTYLRGDGSWATPANNGGGATTTARPVYLVVASADAPAYVKASADYICDGVSDQTDINAALDRAAPLLSRNSASTSTAEQVGMVQLSGGQFNCSGSVLMKTGTTLEGVGMLTQLRATGAGAAPLVALASNQSHLTRLGKMWLDGNSTAGGTGHGIDYDMTGGTSTAGYPDTNSDSNHFVYDLYIDTFTGGTSVRHGIYMHAATTANNRVNYIRDISIRDVSGNGVHLQASSDSFISNVHAGGIILGSGFYINTGNTRISNCKAAYCNTYGFYLGSGRGTITGIEAQDCATGVMFDGSPYVATGVTADTSLNDGILVSTDRLVLTGFSIYNRGTGGRYATTTNGLRFDATYADMMILGQIDDPGVTNKIVGAPGARSFMRASTGSALVTAG